MIQNIFSSAQGQDPLLSPELMERYRQQLAQAQQMQQIQQQQQQTQHDIWSEIDKEIEMLSESEKEMLSQTEEFQETSMAVQTRYQYILNALIKPYMLNDAEGKKALEAQLACVKTVKKRIVKESNKKNELMSEYIEKYSDKSWVEFMEIKKKESSGK